MDNEEVGGAIEGDDLALELLPQGGLRGDHDADRELLAASLHAAAARCSMGGGGEERELRRGVWGIRRETLRTADDARPSCSWSPGNRGENLRPAVELVGLRPGADRQKMAQFTSRPAH